MSVEMNPMGSSSQIVTNNEPPPKERSCITNTFCRHWSQLPILLGGVGGGATAGGASIIFGGATGGPIGAVAGGVACLASLVALYIIGKLKPQKDLEDLVQTDLKREVEQIDTQEKILREELHQLINERERLESLLQQEQQLTKQQAEQLLQFQQLGHELQSTASSFDDNVKIAHSEIARLRDHVADQDRENDETKEHVTKLGSEVSGYDRENAENLEQLRMYETLNKHAGEILDETREVSEKNQKLLSDIVQVTDKIDHEAEKLKASLEQAEEYVGKRKRKSSQRPTCSSSNQIEDV